MAVIRWEPVRELHSLQQEMNRLFGSFLETPGSGASTAGRQWIPAMDLVEREDHFVLRADLPGVREEDVKIELEDTVLTVSGERRAEREEHREGYHRIERATGAFRRSLTLPEGVDAESHQGELRDRRPRDHDSQAGAAPAPARPDQPRQRRISRDRRPVRQRRSCHVDAPSQADPVGAAA